MLWLKSISAFSLTQPVKKPVQSVWPTQYFYSTRPVPDPQPSRFAAVKQQIHNLNVGFEHKLSFSSTVLGVCTHFAPSVCTPQKVSLHNHRVLYKHQRCKTSQPRGFSGEKGEAVPLFAFFFPMNVSTRCSLSLGVDLSVEQTCPGLKSFSMRS